MIAFKFLRADGTGVFTGFRWPLPQAGPGAKPDELRPAPAPPARSHRTPPAQQHLRPDPRRVFYTKLQNRLLRPLLDADKPRARIDIRRALKTLEAAVNDYIANARLAPAI